MTSKRQGVRVGVQPMEGMLCVLGSIRMELVVRLGRDHTRSGHLVAADYQLRPGGRAVNQAMAAARLGCKTALLGALGDDWFGQTITGELVRAGVDLGAVRSVADCRTGLALTQLDESGEGATLVHRGANERMDSAAIEACGPVIAQSSHLLVSLDLPLEAVSTAISVAHEMGVRIILDPVPAHPLPASILRKVTVIVPNENEVMNLSGLEVSGQTSALAACRELLDWGVGAVVLKMAGEGAMVVTGQGTVRVPAVPVRAVDRSVAGDVFAGALGCALVEGADLPEAVEFANYAAALATTRRGLLEAMPTRAEVEALRRERKADADPSAP